jgi:hypothetical protein
VSRLNATGEFAAIQLETESNADACELDAVLVLDIKSAEKTLKSGATGAFSLAFG